MKNAGISSYRGVVFDGVRDTAVLEAIRNTASKVLAVYVDATEATRLRRLAAREQIDLSIEDFRTIEQHPIERGVPALRNTVDAVVCNSDSIDRLAEVLAEHLQAFINPGYA
jgi:dephospho-CoA kinase